MAQAQVQQESCESAGDLDTGSVYRRYSDPGISERKMTFERASPRGFGSLPVKVLVRVFEYLPSTDLLKSVSLVCKHWRYAAMSPQLIKSFTATEQMEMYYIFNQLRKFRLLHAFHIENISDPIPLLMQAAKYLTNLKVLSLRNCNDLCNYVYRYIMYAFPQLEVINLENTSFGDSSFQYSKFTCLTKLKGVNLTNIPNLTMKDILETTLNCANLEELSIRQLPPQVDFTDDKACLIINNLNENLKTLRIDSRSLTDRTFEKIYECSNLTVLYLYNSFNLSMDSLGYILKSLRELKKFGITYNSILTGEDVDMFLRNVPEKFKKLTHLDFTGCSLLNDNGIEAIGNYCPALEDIRLKSCVSLKSIDPICKHCKNLRVLDVAFCYKLNPNFHIPRKLDKVILYEGNQLQPLMEKTKHKKFIRFFLAVSKFTDELERLKN